MALKLKPTILTGVFLLIAATGSAAAQLDIPEELQDWQEWVLKDRAYRDCPFFFNAAAQSREDFVCAWARPLELNVVASGAQFDQQWHIYSDDQWVALPGDARYWPANVTANRQPVNVIERGGRPSVRLPPGSWQLSGRFGWGERPAVLPLPMNTGLVNLSLDDRRVSRPEINQNGLFLGERHLDTRSQDAVQTTVYRLLSDDVPGTLITKLQVDVAGSVREEAFSSILPDEFIPVSLESALPARLEPDGKLRLQLRPGRWEVLLNARAHGVLNTVAKPVARSNMPAQEIWSFVSSDALRVTAAEGAPPVDPSQVGVPGEWLEYPAFRLGENGTLTVTERSRGVTSARNELSLNRTLWLDFDGGGFVVEDAIGGKMQTGWRLDMKQPFELLSAMEYGEPMLVTRGAGEGETGVEVRNENVDVGVIGRIEARGSVPVSGWTSRFADVSATLNLPPGHKLLLALGVDRARGSWVGQWRLLDFFLVLIITISGWRLFGGRAGLIALAALALTYHEAGAPSWLWLNLLIAIALLRVAPAGRLRQAVLGYQVVSALLLAVALLPFFVNQIRMAVYPQLEPQAVTYGYAAAVDALDDEGYPRQSAPPSPEREPFQDKSALSPSVEQIEEIVVGGLSLQQKTFSRYAPNAIVQAGPGIPAWQWNAYTLSWSGPVDAEQSMRLVVMPRWLVSSVRIVGVLLLLAFAAVLATRLPRRAGDVSGLLRKLRANAAVAAIVTAMGLLSVGPGFMSEAAAQIPDTDVLDELRARLLEAPGCAPRCAEIAVADVEVGRDEIALVLHIHAVEDVAVPLPGSLSGWRPDLVSVENGAAQLVRARGGALWLLVGAGRNTVSLRGSIPAADTLELPFPLAPRQLNVTAAGWHVAGVVERRLTSGSLQLTRLRGGGGGEARWESSRFPVFARVTRTLELDLDWQVVTTVERVAPAQGALTLEVPLLPGETVVSGEFTHNDGRIVVSMAPRQQSVTWTSNLPLSSPLTMTAPDAGAWTEVWRFVVGNIWNAEFAGIPESNNPEGAKGVRTAVFHPRNGETLILTATRPEASAGSTLAFDSVDVFVSDGGRTRDVDLRLEYRSTSGAQHDLRLPEAAEITSVRIDGREQTLRADKGRLTVPILPGEHEIHVRWLKSGPMGVRWTSPAIDTGAPASNITIRAGVPRDRWLLATGGPALGPAVLYWSELAALLVLAWLLARVKLTPLKFHHWLLLGLGFSTFNWSALLLVAGWLLLCGIRARWEAELRPWQFNAVQVLIGTATVIALLVIVSALPVGLLGAPDMHVSGYDSHAGQLRWFADRSSALLPQAHMVTVPLWVYKGLILAWALWLSFALLRWLPWVWECFSSRGLWRSRASIAVDEGGSPS